MQRIPLPRSLFNPRCTNNFLDSCAFDPKHAPENVAAQEIRMLDNDGEINLLLTHSNQKEIDHPNTPADVKREAETKIHTIETSLTPDEERRKITIHAILTGNGKPDKYASNAAHIFHAGKYGGYFITTDRRILDKREDLRRVTPIEILTPSEWLQVYYETE